MQTALPLIFVGFAQTLAALARGMHELGRRFCRAGSPVCDRCPLKSQLPAGGPREAEA